MNCEICGSSIRGPPNRIVVEGARLIVCAKCSTHGEDYWQPVAPSKVPERPERPAPKPIKVKPKILTSSLPKTYAELELRDDYASQIRKAREKFGFTQEDLAKRAKERLSIIQKIELGKMIPNVPLSRTLEHVLKMKLLVPAVEPKTPKSALGEAQELTIGDVIQFKKREGKETK
jgi:putative transcription factor